MIAIHDRPGSFSDRWVSYCREKKLEYISIDIFSSDLFKILRSNKVTHLLFQVGAIDYRSDLILKSICFLLEKEGIKIFPNYSTFWHYDDKLKQKYLFELHNVPHAKMHAFYSERETLNWIKNHASYPFVFKLRGGASAKNVKLVKNKTEARQLAKKMFGKGISAAPSVINNLSGKLKRHSKKWDWKKVITRFPQTIARNRKRISEMPPERGYFLAQNFIPDLDRDYRLKVIGDKCWGFIRYTWEEDFRASGSGLHDYDVNKIPIELVKFAFELSSKLKMQSVAFDFVYQGSNPLLLEVSYVYGLDDKQLVGYWTSDLKYHEKNFRPEIFIIENLIQS